MNAAVARLGRSIAVPRRVGLAAGGQEFQVDTYHRAPESMARFRAMNPFHFDPSWRITVPGQPGCDSSSVESIWQGLKVVGGRLDLDMFNRPAHKRPPEDERGAGFDYAASQLMLGESVVDLVTARLLIYLPVYLELVDRFVPIKVIEEIAAVLASGRDVIFFDWDENMDILNDQASFSHSAILAAWFGGRLETEFLDVRGEWLRRRPLPSAVTQHVGELTLGRYRDVHRHRKG